MALLNGKQIKDTTVALDKLNGSGLVAITGTMNFGATSSLTFAKVPVSGTDVTNKTYVDNVLSTAVSSEVSTRTSADASLTSAVSTEVSLRTSNDVVLSTLLIYGII